MIGELTRPAFRALVADLGRLAAAVRSYFAIEARDVENTYAYKAGVDAYARDDEFNPYREGTQSHTEWEKGRKDTERWEMQIW
jgi:hypothetical protein